MFRSEFSYAGKFELPKLLHRHAEDGMAGWSHVGRSSVLVLYFTVTNMEHLFSNNKPGFMGGEGALLLTCLSLRAAAGNSMPENRQSRSSPKKLPAAFTEQEVWHLHQKYTQTSSFQEHVIFPFPTCQACAWKEKSCPIPPPTPPRDVSQRLL